MAQKCHTFITEIIPPNAVSVLPVEENFAHPRGGVEAPKPKYKVTVVINEPDPLQPEPDVRHPRKIQPPPSVHKLPPPRLSISARKNRIEILKRNPVPRPTRGLGRRNDMPTARPGDMQPRNYNQLRSLILVVPAPSMRGIVAEQKMATNTSRPSRPAAVGYNGGRGTGMAAGASSGGGAAGGPK